MHEVSKHLVVQHQAANNLGSETTVAVQLIAGALQMTRTRGKPTLVFS